MRLLVAVAHPDDETFGCGSVLAHATANGIDSVVVCATRGELGEISPVAGHSLDLGLRPHPDRLGAVREAELAAAAAVLGVGRVEMLGWRDSGVGGEPAPGSLAAAPASEIESAIAELVEDVRPDVVVTLDGSDGHRDHAIVRDATLAAVAGATWHPARTYLWCLPRSLLSRFTDDPASGTPDEEITTVIDVRDHLPTRWRAIRAHASQVPPYESMSPWLQQAFLGTDHLIRVHPPWTGGPMEDDWCPRATPGST